MRAAMASQRAMVSSKKRWCVDAEPKAIPGRFTCAYSRNIQSKSAIAASARKGMIALCLLMGRSAQQALELDRGVGLVVAVLHDDRSIEREPPLGSFALGDRARSGYNDRVLRNDERLVLRRADHLLADQVEHG